MNESADRDRKNAATKPTTLPDRVEPDGEEKMSERSLGQDNPLPPSKSAEAFLSAALDSTNTEQTVPPPPGCLEAETREVRSEPPDLDQTKPPSRILPVESLEPERNRDASKVLEAQVVEPGYDSAVVSPGPEGQHRHIAEQDQPEETSGAPSRGSLSRRGRRSARETIDLAQWDGWDASQIDSSALLFKLALSIGTRYQIWCSLHRFEMPSYLMRPPKPRVGWGEMTQEDPVRQWIWTRIARRCLRRRINPMRFIDLIEDDFAQTAYPAPVDHYLDQIDVRCQEMRAVANHQTALAWRSFYRCLEAQWICLRDFSTGFEYAHLGTALAPLDPASGALFPYLIAWEYSMLSTTTLLAPQALLQYVSSKESYDAILGEVIPAPLRWVGEALYDFVDREGD